MGNTNFELGETNFVAEKLKSLACIDCMRNWINDFEDSSKQLLNVSERCSELCLIAPNLRSRLENDLQSIKVNL